MQPMSPDNASAADAPPAAPTVPDAAGVTPAHVDRLPLPDSVVPGNIYWVYAIPIVGIHILALAACFPWLFSWTGLIVMLVGVHVFGQAINICYHRQLTHRSFKTARWLEHFFVLMGLCCMEDTPGRWVATHRFHHQHSDEKADPHSPLVTFLWAHVGWLVIRNPNMQKISIYQKYASDILSDPFYMKLEKKPWFVFYVYVAHAVLFFLVGLGLGWLIDGSAMAGVQFGLSLLVWGVFVRTVAVWHITWSVNSLTHLFGYRNYGDTGDHSTNNFLVAMITVGEGWHNNHHHDQASASNQHRWWEFDISYYEIKIMQWLGLATDVIPPKHKRRQRIAERQAEREKQGSTD